MFLKFGIVLLFNWIDAASTANATLPHISTSVDDHRYVCPEEQIYLTCFARNSWSLSWTSLEYVGQRAAIEFNQDFDRPGVGKLVSLPNGRATLAQMMKTERSISSDLKIIIPSDLNETQVTCTNNRGDAVTKTFMLSREPPTRLTFLGQGKVIAENSTSGITVYNFTWLLPANSESVDIKHMKFQVDQQPPIILMNNTTEIILSLSYGKHNVSVVAVDRCNRQSQADVRQLQVQKGVAYNILNHHNDNSEKSLSGHSSARDITPMLHVLVVFTSLSVICLSSS